MESLDPCVLFGQNLRKARESKNISQEKLAELAGLDRTYISSLERGKRNVCLRNIIKLAEALCILPSELLDK